MTYNIKLIKNTDYTPTYWSGGMASELITYPLDSSFANRNFLWRMGFAKIDIDTSNFSSLPSIKRHIMVTSGQITLTHKDNYSKLLKPFDQDFFMGDWITSTQGRCSVINLMTRKNYDGTLTHINISQKTILNSKNFYPENSNLAAICIHPLNDNVMLQIDSQIFKIEKKDLLCIDLTDNNILPNLNISTNDNTYSTDVIIGVIFIPN